MNRIDLQQTGGFPLETDTLDYMQSAYTALQAIAGLGGDNYVLSGCVAAGASVGDGFVVINGEVLPFRGGLAQANIVIREEKQTRPFENGQVKEVFLTRYATFGNGAGAIAFNSIIRLKKLAEFKDLPTVLSSAIDEDAVDKLATARAVKLLNDKINAQLPTGAIVIWSGAFAAIPNGWALCDGSNDTPNLTDRFVLGAGLNYGVGAVGGEATHRLLEAELPKINLNRANQGLVFTDNRETTQSVDNSNGENNLVSRRNIPEFGGDQPHNNMPPFYALAYIMKL